MSETATVSWEFIGRRLDAVQADTADIRRNMLALTERFSGLEDRMASLERRQGIFEQRLDAFVERQSKLELTAARTHFLLQRLAIKVGGIEDIA